MEQDLRKLNRDRLSKLKSVDKEIISFDSVLEFIDDLATKTAGKYTGVYGIPRGGLIFAVLYSYKTGVPLLLAPQGNCLVIDDDIGTGLTIQGYIGKYDTAVMYSNPECSARPTYIYAFYDNATYKVFPWNVKEDLR